MSSFGAFGAFRTLGALKTLGGEKMVSVGIKELKNSLSRYLSRVKQGEEILISQRGRIIARIIREDPKHVSIREALSPLAMKGSILLPTQKINRDVPPPVELPGKAVSEMVIEDRR